MVSSHRTHHPLPLAVTRRVGAALTVSYMLFVTTSLSLGGGVVVATTAFTTPVVPTRGGFLPHSSVSGWDAPPPKRYRTSHLFTNYNSLSSSWRRRWCGGGTVLRMSPKNNNNRGQQPSEDEMNLQRLECIQSITDFHDGTWVGNKVSSWSVHPNDIARGVIRRKVYDGGYTTEVSTSSLFGESGMSMGLEGGSGIWTLKETFSWEEEEEQNDEGGAGSGDAGGDNKKMHMRVSTRTCQLNGGTDVDSVDGSYSLDGTYPQLPPSILTGTETLIKFGIEHCLAVSDDERVRCFVLYDDENRLERIVICEEKRRQEQATTTKGQKGKKRRKETFQETEYPVEGATYPASLVDEDEEMSARIDRLVGKITGETKTEEDDEKKEERSSFLYQDDEMSASIDRFMDRLQIAGDDDDETEDEKKDKGIPSSSEGSTSSSSSSVKSISPMSSSSGGAASASDTAQDRLEQLSRVLSKTKETDQQQEEDKIERYPIGMFGLTLGVWLGDVIVRDRTEVIASRKTSSSSRRGFGKKRDEDNTSKQDSNPTGTFGTWTMGVQKAAMRYIWDYGDSIRNTADYGRSLGARTADDVMPISTMGNVILNEGRKRRMKPEDRLVYIDYEMGGYAGFLFGSVYVKVPRNLSFNEKKNNLHPFFTEFCVFQQRTTSEEDDDDEKKKNEFDEDISFEAYCSKMTRLYTKEGRLRQGSTSFYTMKPILSEE